MRVLSNFAFPFLLDYQGKNKRILEVTFLRRPSEEVDEKYLKLRDYGMSSKPL